MVHIFCVILGLKGLIYVGAVLFCCGDAECCMFEMHVSYKAIDEVHHPLYVYEESVVLKFFSFLRLNLQIWSRFVSDSYTVIIFL